MKEFDFDPEKDNVSNTTLAWIILISLGMAVYLSQILV